MGNECCKTLFFQEETKKRKYQKSWNKKRGKRPYQDHRPPSGENVDIDIIHDDKPRKNSTDSDESSDIEVADEEAFNDQFIQQRQKAIDNSSYRSKIESWQPSSLEHLSRLIKALSKGKSMIDRHWIIFYWITFNIQYDTVSYFSKDYKDQTAEGVFLSKKGVCAGYANIYKYLSDQLELPCEVVSGYSKGYGFDDRDGATPMETDHAWNVVEIYHHWYLMESTWGAGHLNDQKQFKRELTSYYFLPRPNEMIYHHLPEDPQWQLLKSPIKMEQYLQLPKLRPDYFEFKLDMIQPRYRCFIDFEQNKSYGLIIMNAPVGIALTTDLKQHDKVIPFSDQIIFNKKKRSHYCYFAPPNIGQYRATVYAKHGDTDVGVYRCVLDLKFDVTAMPENPISYPKLWKNFFDYRIDILSPLNTHLINIGKNKKYGEIILRTRPDVVLLGKLTNENEEKIKGGDQVYYDREKDFWRCQFAPNKNGLFNALILAKKKSDPDSYTSTILFQISTNNVLRHFVSFPKTWETFYNLGLKILSPIDEGIIVLNNKTPYAKILIKTPKDILLLSQLQNEQNEDISNGANIHYDADEDNWLCTFAPNQCGTFEGLILAKKKSDSELYTAAVSFSLEVKQRSSKAIYLLDTTQVYYDLSLEVLPPHDQNKIILSEKTNYVEICLKTPDTVDLLAELKNSTNTEIPYSHQLYYDRHENIWRCKFAPNNKGNFYATILAKKKSERGLYTVAVTFPIEVNHIPSSNLTFPTTLQSFFDYDLKIKSPRSRASPKWSEKSSYTEVLIQAPDDIQLSSSIQRNKIPVENGSLTQYDHERQLWQFLFAPEQTGSHELIIFAKRINDKATAAGAVAIFPLNVTKVEQPMKFPLTYTHFETTKCQIYNPLYGILKRNTTVAIHCRIPGAKSVMITAGARTLRGEGYTDPIFQREITVGSEEIIVSVKYEQTPHYTTLIKYSVE
ncbi:unnamed protein product [Rotaria magnacalcarata]|uniref:Transglutaminase-like domain-containing protein n=4 Tax=Rotaria magnacalcarata TaxID=392030 RepID=A0A815E5B5_9BILA|nr:unnamed protein product [Rotaria magnacalcarata]CAF1601815.1 unnamed protein product [Rotaria magnacalcarata]